MKCEIQCSISILLMTYVCALQQTLSVPELLTRHDTTGSGSSIPVDEETYNTLPQIGPSAKLADRAGMEDSSETTESKWLCGGAKGFLCLTLAVFRQPLVDGINFSINI